MTSSSLQNMAPNTQRALFITLIFGAVAIIVYMFCIQPTQQALVRGRNDLDSVQARANVAASDIRGYDALKERLAKIQGERKRYTDALLVPLLESYAMRAKSVLDPVASESGVTTLDYQEKPRRLLPLTKPQAPQLYARQPIQLSCRGSYQAIVSFVMRVEKLFPLVAVESFSLRASNGSDVQMAEIVFEWPIEGVNTVAAAKAKAKGGKK